MDAEDPAAQLLLQCPACPGCVQRDKVIADQARALERVTSELRWHGLDDNALTVRQAYEILERAWQGKKSWPVYRSLLAPLVAKLSHLPCLQLNAERWAQHRAERSTEKCGRWGRSKTPTSGHLDQELTLARMMFRHLVATQQLPRNPLEFAKRANEPSGRETCLKDADVRQKLADGAHHLWGETENHQRREKLFRAFVLVKYGAGLRFEEARNLRWDRIGGHGELEISAKRTKSKRRGTVALPAYALDAIAELPQLDGDPHVFTHRHAGEVVVVSSSALHEWFDIVCEKTGVSRLAVEGEKVVPHVLRHSAASHLETMGAHPLEIRDFLRHKSLGTTERYLHGRDAERALAMAALMERRPPQRQPSGEFLGRKRELAKSR